MVSCLLSEQFAAAHVLCEKVIALEPSNATAQELQPILQERLALSTSRSQERHECKVLPLLSSTDNELPTESSSSESSSQSNSSNSGDTDDEEEQLSHTHCHS